MKKVCLLNLGHSNIKSVMGAFDEIDVETTVIEQIDSLEINAPLVLSCVCAFGEELKLLFFCDSFDVLSLAYKIGQNILGICLGL